MYFVEFILVLLMFGESLISDLWGSSCVLCQQCIFKHFSLVFGRCQSKFDSRWAFVDKVGNHEFRRPSGARQRGASRDVTMSIFVTGPCQYL